MKGRKKKKKKTIVKLKINAMKIKSVQQFPNKAIFWNLSVYFFAHKV